MGNLWMYHIWILRKQVVTHKVNREMVNGSLLWWETVTTVMQQGYCVHLLTSQRQVGKASTTNRYILSFIGYLEASYFDTWIHFRSVNLKMYSNGIIIPQDMWENTNKLFLYSHSFRRIELRLGFFLFLSLVRDLLAFFSHVN